MLLVEAENIVDVDFVLERKRKKRLVIALLTNLINVYNKSS